MLHIHYNVCLLYKNFSCLNKKWKFSGKRRSKRIYFENVVNKNDEEVNT